MPRRGGWSRLSTWLVAAAAAAGLVMACSSFGTSSSDTDAGASDGGSDVAVDALPTGPFCAAHTPALICDDFDDPKRGVWMQPNVADGGVLHVVSGAGAVSSPGALEATIVLPSTKVCQDVYENAEFDVAAPNGFHLEFKVRGDKLPPGAGTFIGPSVKMDSPSDTCDYYLHVGPAGTELVQEHVNATTLNTSLGRKLTPGVWSPVTIDVAGPASARTVSVSIDGVIALKDQPVDAACQGTTRIVETGIGLYCVNSDSLGDVAISFDDVLVTVR